MSDKHARSHTNKSNRANVRDAIERKVVYKSVLDNPLGVSWPKVAVNVQNAILSQAVAVLNGVASYHIQRQRDSRKRKKSEGQDRRARKKPRSSSGSSKAVEETYQAPQVPHTDGIDDLCTPQSEHKDDGPTVTLTAPSAPEILHHITCGINEVTKKLETLSKALRQHSRSSSSDALGTRQEESQLVLVCVGDINPPVLVDHLPHLVAVCNSARQTGEDSCTWLVPLPSGAECVLAEAMGLRRVSALSMSSFAPGFEHLRQFLASVTILRAPWVRPSPMELPHALVPTHIKQLRTTAPKDMWAAKERRLQERREAKRRRKSAGATQ